MTCVTFCFRQMWRIVAFDEAWALLNLKPGGHKIFSWSTKCWLSAAYNEPTGQLEFSMRSEHEFVDSAEVWNHVWTWDCRHFSWNDLQMSSSRTLLTQLFAREKKNSRRWNDSLIFTSMWHYNYDRCKEFRSSMVAELNRSQALAVMKSDYPVLGAGWARPTINKRIR